MAKPEGQSKPHLRLTVYEVAVLLHALIRAAAHDHIGYNDAHMTVADLKKRLDDMMVLVDPAIIERLFYAANMLDERNLFASILNEREPFKVFCNRIMRRTGAHKYWYFDKEYHLFRKKEF